ncbi:MAG: hypothetical protein ACRBBQ_03275 [Cognatishimia sp.]
MTENSNPNSPISNDNMSFWIFGSATVSFVSVGFFYLAQPTDSFALFGVFALWLLPIIVGFVCVGEANTDPIKVPTAMKVGFWAMLGFLLVSKILHSFFGIKEGNELIGNFLSAWSNELRFAISFGLPLLLLWMGLRARRFDLNA